MFPASSVVTTQRCISIMGMAVNGNQVNTLTLPASNDYTVNGVGNDFAGFVLLTIVDSNTSKTL